MKKVLSLFLSVVMIISMLAGINITSYADDDKDLIGNVDCVTESFYGDKLYTTSYYFAFWFPDDDDITVLEEDVDYVVNGWCMMDEEEFWALDDEYRFNGNEDAYSDCYFAEYPEEYDEDYCLWISGIGRFEGEKYCFISGWNPDRAEGDDEDEPYIDIDECEEIFAGETKTVYSDPTYFKFIPEEDCAYTLYSESDGDPYATLYDEYMEELASNDDADGYDFSLSYYGFVAGQTYIFRVSYYSMDSDSFDVTLVEGGGNGGSGDDEDYDTSIASITYTPASPIIYKENNGGWYDDVYEWDEDAEVDVYVETYYRYYLPESQNGDVIEICKEDDGSIQRYVYDENEYAFINEENSDDVIYGEDLWLRSNQYYDHWSIGENYFEIEYRGHTCSVPVTIIENDVLSVSAVVKNQFINDYSGTVYYDDNDEQYFYYIADYCDFDVTITTKDGNTETVTLKNYDEYNDSYFCVIDSKTVGDTVEIMLEYSGVRFTATAEIVENPVSDISVKQIKPINGDTYNCGDENFADYVCGDCLLEDGAIEITVKYNDGTSETFTTSELSGEYHAGGYSMDDDYNYVYEPYSTTKYMFYIGKYVLPVNIEYLEKYVELDEYYGKNIIEDGTEFNFSICDFNEGIVINFSDELDAPHNHEYELAEQTDPTCTKEGIKVYRCVHCDDEYTETIPVISHTEEIIPAVEPTCTAEGSTEGVKCSVCDQILIDPKPIDKIPHTYKDVVTKATLSRNGKIVPTCSCGATDNETTIYYPKTITLSATSYTYDGKAKTPTVTVKDSNGKALTEKVDYTVSCGASNVTVGEYKVTVSFIGNYSGSKELTYQIVPKQSAISTVRQEAGGFTINWAKVEGGITGYQIQYATRSDFSNAATVYAGNVTATSKTITGRANGTRYYLRLRAYKKIGNNEYIFYPWSSAKNIVTPAKPATARIASLTGGYRSFAVRWNKVTGDITGYQIQYATRSDFSNAATIYAGNASATSKNVTGRAPASRYYVRVRAYKNVNGNYVWGNWSSAVSVKTK